MKREAWLPASESQPLLPGVRAFVIAVRVTEAAHALPGLIKLITCLLSIRRLSWRDAHQREPDWLARWHTVP